MTTPMPPSHTSKPSPRLNSFQDGVRRALDNPDLQDALSRAGPGLIGKRAQALEQVANFEALRAEGMRIKQHALSHLDGYALLFEQAVQRMGGHVHWARDVAEAQDILLGLCQQYDAHSVLKGKSMISEEMGVNHALEQAGYHVLETDLGEYIIQLRGEPPSHIIAPAVHLKRQAVRETFLTAHTMRDASRNLDTPELLLQEARDELRTRYGKADIGITGANFLIAETGASVIVTNEGNGDLTQNNARVHVVLASLEKLIPTLNDSALLIRLLTRSATGQEASVYTSFAHGPKRDDDPDGPEAYHVILLDHGRSDMLGAPTAQMLSCLRCGACMNHCPVYHAVGGHAYDAVYVGPMGAVLSPSLFGLEAHADLPHASSFCGRCREVCPVQIDLPGLMRHLRHDTFQQRIVSQRSRWALLAWGFFARRPAIYRFLSSWAMRFVRFGMLYLPFAVQPFVMGWCRGRTLPIPQGDTFQDLFQRTSQRHSD